MVRSCTPDGVILEDSVMDPMGLNLEPYRQSIDIDDRPLSEMGSGTTEMLSTPEALPRDMPMPQPDVRPNGPNH